MRILKRRTWGDNPGDWRERIAWPSVYGYALCGLVFIGVLFI